MVERNDEHVPPHKRVLNDDLTAEQLNDKVIYVTLSREDYAVLRDMLEKQKSLKWLGKSVYSIIFIGLGSLITIITFGDSIKRIVVAIASFFMGGGS